MSTSPKHLGKYELQERLGRGGMAEVWKGFDPQLKRYVAIKFLHANLRSDPDFTNRFQREGQAIAALRHPNIVQVYDFQVSSSEEEDEVPIAYMVMDYIEGPTLADYIRRTSYAHNFPLHEEIIRLFTPISLAIDYAHRQRMIHRDIKPANILLDTRNTLHNAMGEPILTDFGIVKMLGTATITSTGTSMGTPLYISPEQVQGQPGNERSDIYSLGVMLYEICSGVPLYRGDTPYAVMAQHVTGKPIPPSRHNTHISSEVDAVILCALAKDPQARFANAAALIVALSAAFHLPVPDQVRDSISSFNLEVQQPSSSSASHPELPEVETFPTITQNEKEESFKGNGKAPVLGEETVLSEPTNVDAGQHKNRPSGVNHPLPADAVSPAGPVIPLPPIKMVEATPVLPVSQTNPPHPPVHTRRSLFIIVSILLIIMLLGGSIGIYALFHRGVAVSPTPTIVGTATFFSSELDNYGAASINDGITVNLQHVPDPTAGNRYYGWLQNDSQVEATPVYLGVLHVDHGNATLYYTDTPHRDLLAQMTTFLVTEQTTSVTPENPSLDTKQWSYYATFPQKLSPLDPYSYLDHIRHLLSGEPGLSNLHLQNGVDFWLLNNTEELYKNAIEARDDNDVHAVRQLITDVLFYLDGKCASQDLLGAPGGSKTPENSTIARATSVSLLDCAQLVEPQGHVKHVALHLNGIVKAPGASAQHIKLAAQISSQLDQVRAWLQQVRIDTMQLAQMDDAQLSQAQTLRNELVVQTNYAMSGRVDLATQTLQPGVEQICDEVSLLANFEVVQYKSS